MNISRINTPFRGSQWRQQFADSMISLCPQVNPDAIDEMADAEYPVSSEVEPALAARCYAMLHRFIPSLPDFDGAGGSPNQTRVSGSR